MSFQNFVIGRLTALTSAINSIVTNAKKVEELPVQTILNPNSKIPVSNDGNSEYITVQQIIDSAEISNENQLLSVGNITVVGTNIIVESGLSGLINGILYSISSDTTVPISLCDNGFNRKDILVLTRNNTVISISGEETNGSIVIAPPTPIDTAYITTFDVSDSNIGLPQDPIIGSDFVKKSFAYYFNANISGTEASIPFDAAGKTEIRLTNTALESIASINLTELDSVTTAERPYPSKPYLVKNITGNAITILHDAELDDNIEGQRPRFYAFALKEAQDLELPNNEAILFHFTDGKMVEIFRSWSNSALNLVDATGDAAFTKQIVAKPDGTLGVEDKYGVTSGWQNIVLAPGVFAQEAARYRVKGNTVEIDIRSIYYNGVYANFGSIPQSLAPKGGVPTVFFHGYSSSGASAIIAFKSTGQLTAVTTTAHAFTFNFQWDIL